MPSILGRARPVCYTRGMLESMNRVARFFDMDYAGFDVDLDMVEAFAKRTGSPLLELGCGTGRALVPLARKGYQITGVDISPEMLAIAREKIKAARLGRRITLVEADFTDFRLGGAFRFAFVLMNTFMHLTTTRDQLRALNRWREHLDPGGLLLIDLFNPDAHRLASLDGILEWDKSWVDPQTGATITKLVTRTVDLAKQTLQVTLIYDEVTPDGQVRRTLAPYTIRYLWRYEAELLLDKAGFELEGLYGGWDLEPFSSDSEQMILVARRG